jgi:hypothetical protein
MLKRVLFEKREKLRLFTRCSALLRISYAILDGVLYLALVMEVNGLEGNIWSMKRKKRLKVKEI